MSAGPRRRWRRYGVIKLIASGFAMALAGAGCSLIVSGDVPDFKCAGTSTSACPSGLVCDVTSGRCVSDAGVEPIDAGEEDAPVDEDVRDAAKEADATGPLDIGAKCRVDNECKSRLCGTSTILTTTITSSTGPICTTPCCTSVDCTAGNVCFNGGTGGGYCVPATLASRTPPASGGKSGGSTCTVNTDCRSGLCDKPDAGSARCFDTCCSASECGGGTCRVKTASAPGPTHDVWVCAVPESGATKVPGDQCVDSTDCASDACIGIAGPSRICRPPCSNSASCKAIPGFAAGHCLYGSSGSDYFKFCFSGTIGSRSAAGVACVDDSTCQSDYCDGELKKCLNVCGKDSDCASNEACRPSAANTPYLRCVPKP
jgi:hypothetical protein